MLLGRLLAESAEDTIQSLKGILGPDNEAADVTTRGKLEKVQSLHRADVDTRDVAEGLRNAIILVVDNERATANDVAAVAHLANTSADLARVL